MAFQLSIDSNTQISHCFIVLLSTQAISGGSPSFTSVSQQSFDSRHYPSGEDRAIGMAVTAFREGPRRTRNSNAVEPSSNLDDNDDGEFEWNEDNAM